MGKLVIRRRQIVYVLLTVLLSYTILFPADKLNLKEILLLSTMFVGYVGKKIQVQPKIIVFGLLLPLLAIVYSLLRGVSVSNAFSFGYVWLFLLLIPIIKEYEFNIKNVFLRSTYIIAIIIDLIMIMDLIGIVPIKENFIASFFSSMNELQGLGKGLAATFGYSIFYKSCPLIILTYAYYIYNKKIAKSAPLLLALFACGTRANFLITIALTIIIPIIYWKNSKKNLLIAISIIVLSAIFTPFIYDKFVNLNRIKYGSSEAIKIADTKIIYNNMKNSPLDLAAGTGVGSSFISSRGREMLTYEFSLIDYARQVGIIGLIIYMIFVIAIIKRLKREKYYWLIAALMGYIAVALTNPLLVTSTSFMAYVFAICYDEKQSKTITDKGEISNE